MFAPAPVLTADDLNTAFVAVFASQPPVVETIKVSARARYCS
jgi:hypothetical protein